MLRKLLKKMLNFGFVENSQIKYMIIYPPSKINIGLYVTGKRDDGYHNIYSVFYPLKLCDILEFLQFDEGHGASDQLELSGMGIPGDKSGNLLLKACRAVREKSGLPFLKLHLHKQIPVGAGLGGGSSDAASLLKELGQIASPRLDPESLRGMALQLGSDCPFFLDPETSVAVGRGEELKRIEIDLQGYWLSIFNPGIHVSTAEAYGLVEIGEPDYSIEEVLKEPPVVWENRIDNVFEEPVFRMFPRIREIKEELYKSGAAYASMSGSGSSVFGIFDKKARFSGRLGKYHIWTEEL